MYLDAGSGECKKCQAGCLECKGPKFCDACDPNVHQLKYPENGQCFCDAFRGWYPVSDAEPWHCTCFKNFLTPDNQCLDCADAFPQCTSCERVGGLDADLKVGLKSVFRDKMPDSQEGHYVCKNCGRNDGTQFFNYEKNLCESCSARIQGCSGCDSSGTTCSSCKAKHFLTSSGSCFNCAQKDKDCYQCDEARCKSCESGYFILPGINYCALNPFHGLF